MKSSILLSEGEGDFYYLAADGNGHWVTFTKDSYGTSGESNNIIGYSTDGGENWTKSTFSTSGDLEYFKRITYDSGAGIWIIVGSNVYTSSDGRGWLQILKNLPLILLDKK
jgi:dihydrofolate reductase